MVFDSSSITWLCLRPGSMIAISRFHYLQFYRSETQVIRTCRKEHSASEAQYGVLNRCIHQGWLKGNIDLLCLPYEQVAISYPALQPATDLRRGPWHNAISSLLASHQFHHHVHLISEASAIDHLDLSETRHRPLTTCNTALRALPVDQSSSAEHAMTYCGVAVSRVRASHCSNDSLHSHPASRGAGFPASGMYIEVTLNILLSTR